MFLRLHNVIFPVDHCIRMPYCTDCGYDIPPGTRFCPSCGADQTITLPQFAKGSPSKFPIILGILAIIVGVIIPIGGLAMGTLGAVLAHTDKNKTSNTYTFVCILAIIASLIFWGVYFIVQINLYGF